MGECSVKKSIYPPCLILLVLLLVPVTACTTKTAAEKPQDTPSRQEQPAGNTSAADEPMQSAQPAPAETQPSKSAVQSDAVSGATIDTVSGATVSQRQKKTPVPEAVGADKNMATGGAAVSQKRHTPAAPAGKTGAKVAAAKKEKRSAQSDPIAADKTAGQKNTAADKTTGLETAAATKAQAEPTTPAAAQEPPEVSSPALAAANTSVPTKTAGEAEQTAAAGDSVPAETADELKPADSASNPDTAAAENTAPPAAATDTAAENTAATADTAAEQLPTAPSTGEPVPLAAADTPDPAAEQNVPAYETTLADLISDFEQQGGSHGYEPPPTFHEEMLDLFSPQIFTVALSKEPETVQKPKVSRMVAVEEKQRLELTYPGHGWVYVGEQTSQPGLKYEQRKLQDNNSIFMFTAEKKGDYVLHFSYFDVFTNEFITDAVAVSVSAARSPAAKAMVKAPEYQGESDSDTAEAETAKAVQTTPQLSSSSDDIAAAVSAAQSTPGTAASQAAAENIDASTGQASAAAAAEESLSPDQLLERARTAIASADAGTALTYLDTFFTTAEEKLDEGWFLKGRAYELNGSARNIRLALDAYRTLTDTFPQSKFWAEADARIRYITGFYINIR